MVGVGIYNEAISIDKSLTLLGAQAGVDARNRNGDETIIDPNDPSGGANNLGSFGASEQCNNRRIYNPESFLNLWKCRSDRYYRCLE